MRRSRSFVLLVAVCGLTACGGSGSHPAAPPAKLVHVRGSSTPGILLTPLGRDRIGIRTAAAVGGGRGQTSVPFAAVLYEQDGTPIVYTNPRPGLYTRVRVTISSIAGNRVFVRGAPAPGTRVVVVGAEELLGVQTGVGAET